MQMKVVPISKIMNCKALKSVKLPNRLKHIGDSAFRECDSLYSMTLPTSVHHIGNISFPEHLKELHVGYKAPQKAHLSYYPYYKNEEETTLYVPKGTKKKYENDETFGDFMRIVEE